MGMSRRDLLKSGLFAGSAVLLGSSFLMKTVWADPKRVKNFLTESEEEASLTLWQLPNQTSTQMMSYILKTSDGSVIVIDGGNAGDADYLFEMIHQISPEGRVDAWLLTHIHSDHGTALSKILQEKPDGLKIGAVYFDFPPLDWVKEYETGSFGPGEYIMKGLDLFERKGALKETLTFGDVRVSALNTFDLAITKNPINNASIVYRIETPATSLLFLGDLGVEGGDRLVSLVGPEKIKADIVQMAHHGQNGVKREFYEIVAPDVCLWPTPDWLWNNNSGNGDGSGPWKTLQNRAWMDDLGVKNHYAMKDGLKQIFVR